MVDAALEGPETMRTALGLARRGIGSRVGGIDLVPGRIFHRTVTLWLGAGVVGCSL